MIASSVRITGFVLFGVALLTTAACSSGSGGTTPGTTTAAAAADGPVRFTQCVRDKGFDLPDPPAGAQSVELPPNAKTDPAMADAIEECRHFLGEGSGKEAGDPEQQDRALALARCLREQGIPVEDPAPGQPLRLDVDSKDPKAMQAVQDCRSQVAKQFEGGSAEGQSGGR